MPVKKNVYLIPAGLPVISHAHGLALPLSKWQFTAVLILEEPNESHFFPEE